MADLEVILASGDIGDLKVSGNQVIRKDNFVTELEDGVEIPHVLTADAGMGKLYWDHGVGRLRMKTVSGIVLEFDMTLV